LWNVKVKIYKVYINVWDGERGRRRRRPTLILVGTIKWEKISRYSFEKKSRERREKKEKRKEGMEGPHAFTTSTTTTTTVRLTHMHSHTLYSTGN